jgi:hypothetical protein
MNLFDLFLATALMGLLENISPQTWPPEHAVDLATDGYTVFPLSQVEMAAGNFTEVLKHLPAGYVFLDYDYTIRGTALTTWHRDVTSGQTYHDTVHPTYTLIHYLTPGNLLTVIPKSHLTYPFALGRTQMIASTEGGTAVLFNADLLHAAGPKNNSERLAVQYKIAHKEDHLRLAHLQGIHTCKEGPTEPMRPSDWAKRVMSWSWAWLLNLRPIAHLLQERQASHTIGGMLQQAVALDFFNR